MSRFSVAIGVGKYPHYPGKDLRYAERDADGFNQWASANDGGEVPGPQRMLFTSENSTAANPVPVQTHVDDQLLTFNMDMQTLLQNTLGAQQPIVRAQARLYLFFSGHGVGPTATDVAMLMSDARLGASRNLGAQQYLDFLCAVGAYGNLVLFADCCRELGSAVSPRMPTLDATGARTNDVKVNAFYAIGHGGVALEPVPDGDDGDVDRDSDALRDHGFFTRAVLEGLWGAAADPSSGDVTIENLQAWVEVRLKALSDGRQELSTNIGNRHLVLATLGDGLDVGESADRFSAYVDAMDERLGQANLDGSAGADLKKHVQSIRQQALAEFAQSVAGGTEPDQPFVPADASAAPIVSYTIAFPPDFAGVIILKDGSSTEIEQFTLTAGQELALDLPEGLYKVETTDGSAFAMPFFQVPNGGNRAQLSRG